MPLPRHRQNIKNDKKRLREFLQNLELFRSEGKRIILKKAPTPAMVVAANKYGLEARDLFHETLSPAEQQRRDDEVKAYEREQYGKQAMQTNGQYNPTGKQEKLSSHEEYKKDYFSMSDEEMKAEHKRVQLNRDITRGWNCPICKGIIPEMNDLPSGDDEENYVKIDKTVKERECNFIFHKNCYAKWQEGEAKKASAVHRVNTREQKLKEYLSWGKS